MAEKEDVNLLARIGPKLLELLSKHAEIELEDIEINIGDLEISFQPGMPVPVISKPPMAPVKKEKPSVLLEVEFQPKKTTYPGKIIEVELGATKKDGGTRGKTLTIGGETAPPYYLFDSPIVNTPVISFDVFDMKIPLAKAVKDHVRDVIEDPAEWAKKSVEKFGAEMVTLHLVSIDPLIKDTSPSKAAKTVENVLQAVDVPISVGGCGDTAKDLKVFQKIAEVTSGERVFFNSITLEQNLEKMTAFIKKYGHVVLAFTQMDMAQARELNRKLYAYLPKQDIVMDTTTAALGYGLDYAFTVMERNRLAALMGDTELNHPLASGTTNAWAAREAWMKMAPEWGPRELRGPMWETVTALTLLLAGVDYFMMMHPAAVKTLKDVIKELTSGRKGASERIEEWVSISI
ncbi:MAG: CO dehydrogenase/acetyl-CoA synthase subunit delta [Candidatus Bathyarchaeota archaeon]|nr:MAG: CO dehydrogenase/acetyl-CoA synthase subunit delta [Candidatus Bathyarchaeota archaeon]